MEPAVGRPRGNYGRCSFQSFVWKLIGSTLPRPIGYTMRFLCYSLSTIGSLVGESCANIYGNPFCFAIFNTKQAIRRIIGFQISREWFVLQHCMLSFERHTRKSVNQSEAVEHVIQQQFGVAGDSSLAVNWVRSLSDWTTFVVLLIFHLVSCSLSESFWVQLQSVQSQPEGNWDLRFPLIFIKNYAISLISVTYIYDNNSTNPRLCKVQYYAIARLCLHGAYEYPLYDQSRTSTLSPSCQVSSAS